MAGDPNRPSEPLPSIREVFPGKLRLKSLRNSDSDKALQTSSRLRRHRRLQPKNFKVIRNRRKLL